MNISSSNKIIVIVGPNASGKSNLGVRIAQQFKGEIISADSRQVYKGLDVGSGKITKKEMGGIPHYCLDIASPKNTFTAEGFKRYGVHAMKTIQSKNKIPIIVGGTGFYIDVLLGRMQIAGIPPNQKLRRQLAKKSTSELFAMLKKLNLMRAKTIDKNNSHRLMRAIEISLATGYASHPHAGRTGYNASTNSTGNTGSKNKLPSDITILWLGVKRSPEALKKRIHKRLITRLPYIILEVKKLHTNGLSWKRMDKLGLEYRYGALYAQNKLTKKEFIRQLETAIWHYARRQMTWFKKNEAIHWITSSKNALRLIKNFKTQCTA